LLASKSLGLIIQAFNLCPFSVVISKLAEGNKNLIQEVGILKAELKKLQLRVKEKE
jgi:hypothetical protein